MKAEIIAVGTELLLGQVVNTNATFLSEELASLGIDVFYHSVVGDNPNRLEELLTIADKRSDLIVLCGGLGPTEPGYHQLKAFFENSQRRMTENNLRQTLVFKDGVSLPNPNGLAIGIFYQTAATSYLLLPGPPSELQAMFLTHAKPLLLEQFPQEEVLLSRVLRYYGIGESALIENQVNPTIAPYAKPNEVTLRLTVKTADEAQGIKQLDALEEAVQARVGAYFYGYGEQNSLAETVVDLLIEKKKTVTAAESLTAGLFQATLGGIPGVSEVFPGGFVTYSAGTKSKLLGIDSALLESYGTVSQECAEAMAVYARKQAETDYAVAFTGVAGPDELEGQPKGTVWIALASDKGVSSQLYHFNRDRAYIRHSAVMAGLNQIRKELLN